MVIPFSPNPAAKRFNNCCGGSTTNQDGSTSCVAERRGFESDCYNVASNPLAFKQPSLLELFV